MAGVFAGLHICLEKPLSVSMGESMQKVTDHGGQWCNMNKQTHYLVSNAWSSERRAFKSALAYKVPVVTAGSK
jgi:hypothetical protein